MLLTILAVLVIFVAGMVTLDLLTRLSGGKIVLPEDSFLVRFWHERREGNPRTLCEIILLLMTTTIGNIIGAMFLVALLVAVVVGIPVVLVKSTLEIGFVETTLSSGIFVGVLVLSMAIIIGATIGTIKVGEMLRVSRIVNPIFRVAMWPFQMGVAIYRIVRDRACPIVEIQATS